MVVLYAVSCRCFLRFVGNFERVLFMCGCCVVAEEDPVEARLFDPPFLPLLIYPQTQQF